MALRKWTLKDLERRLGTPTARGTNQLPGLKRNSYVVWYCFAAGEEPSADRPTRTCPAACIATTGQYDSESSIPIDGWVLDPCPTHRAIVDEL